MKGILCILIFILCCYPVTAQVNYVRNPSLEVHDSCPYAGDQIRFANYWTAIDSTGVHRTPTDGEPDYCNTCDTFSLSEIKVPSNTFFNHYPRTGNGMANVQMFFDENTPDVYQRDYLQGRLLDTLTTGKSYCVTFYVTLAQYSRYGINHIGAYLDNGEIDTTVNPGLPQTEYTPQIVETNIISDSINWTKIEGSFVATGKEKFITIGNFYSKANTSYTVFNPNGSGNFTWYLIDDISVIESDTKAFAWGSDTLHKGYLDSFLLGRDETIPGIKWWRDGVLIDTLNAGIWCKDDTVGTYHTYIVSQTLCGATTYDTVVVSVELVSVKTPTISSQASPLVVWPNPNKGEFTVSGNIKSKEATIEIFNALGQSIYKNIALAQDHYLQEQIKLNAPAGIYVVKIHTEDGNHIVRLVLSE